MNSDTNTESNHEPNQDEPLDPGSLIDRLAANGVLAAEEDSGDLVLTEDFLELVRDSRQAVTEAVEGGQDADVTGLLQELNLGGDEDRVDELLASTDDEEIIAEYVALVRTDVADFSAEDRLRSLPLLDALRGEIPDEGSPDPFVPVRGPSLPVLLPLYERAIVYTWREECPPCDVMREAFEAVLEEPPADIALFSVYGPDNAELLHEHYDVVGGPTTLFCYRGSVDARLAGAYAEQIVESEVRKLREVDPTAADV